jgi:ribosomal protein S12 methylthiotransferase
MPNQVDEQTKVSRAENIMEMQMDIMREKNEEKIGTVTEVLIEGWDDYIKCYFGRTVSDAPAVDGKIFFMSTRPLSIGDFANVRVNDSIDYDLLGELEEQQNETPQININIVDNSNLEKTLYEGE